jgi:hypothetical protein
LEIIWSPRHSHTDFEDKLTYFLLNILAW